MIDLRFESEAVPVDTFQVLQFDGEEEISHLFRFELRLVSRDPEIDLAAVLQSHAKLAITTQDNTRYVHGMLCEFEQGGEWHSGLYEYRAVLVPRLWMMTQSTQNQIFQTRTVPDIVESELGSVAQKGRHPLVAAGLGVDDYEIYNTGSYAEREYVVQFKETDFNFISRLMEHEGIYYYFEHDERREKMVITDTMATEQISAQNSAAFQANATAARYDDSVVHKLSRIQSQIPGSVLISDHNYRSPDLPMQATGDVAQDGIGFVTEFGAHFKSPEEGVTLATIRAEEYRCRQNIYAGESNIASFACGHLCALDRHFRNDYNQDYLLTKVKHHGSQDIESWGKVGSTSYHNEFSCIPANIPYRPQRLTPKPRLYGVMNGTIDSEQDLGRADLDDQGRYKVKMPFDISGAGEGMGSRRIRMAQPYGGGGSGMSFPLVKGTEVIWTCIDGDIDRPIITGTVPNPLNPSVTTTENANSNVIKTTSGITMGFHDGSGGGSTTATGGDSSLASQQQNQQVVTSTGVDAEILGFADSAPVTASTTESKEISNPLELQQQNAGGANLHGTDSTSCFVLHVPGHSIDSDSGVGRSYFSMGDISAAANKDLAFQDVQQEKGGGIYSYTDGVRVTVTKGDDDHWHYGGSSDYFKAPQFSAFNDSNMEYYLGHSFDFKAGLIGEVTAGVKSSVNMAIDMELSMGLKCNVAFEHSYSSVAGDSVDLAGDIRQEANNTIKLRCDPEDEKLDSFMENTAPKLAAVAAGAVVVGGLVASIDEGSIGGAGNEAAIATATATYAATTALSVAALVHFRSVVKKQGGDPGAAYLDMDGKTISMGLNGVKGNAKGYTNADDKTITLSARNYDKPDTEAVMMKLEKSGASDAANTILLQCGKQTDSTGSLVSIEDGSLKLKLGSSSIEIQDKKMVFKADDFEFLHSDGGKLTIKKGPGMVLTKGGFVVKDGSVKASKVTKGEDIKGKKCTIGGLSVTG